MKRRLFFLLIIAIYGLTAAGFWATSVRTATIYPNKDSYSWQSVPLANNGHSNNFEITSYNKPPYNMRGWIEFNITSLPSEAWVISAKLSLRLWVKFSNEPSVGNGDSTGRIYGVYRLTNSWKEDEVNWVNQPNYTEEHYSSAPVPKGEGGWYGPLLWMEWDITNIMKDWRSGVPNYGMVVRDTQENSPIFYTTQFFTHDQVPDSSYYPRLLVTYVYPWNLATLAGVFAVEGVLIIRIKKRRFDRPSKGE